ncbi:sporulation protein YqfC [Polycladospora coralii]|uniref:sporulation protein YqfC n=1 Tax=Polycladospora coralii TaxID=2771432 RepID=UPI001CD0D3FC|nr:sporulation protein YqfC [Polycladospora coralii]
MRKWATEWLDLPPDVTSDAPRIEMIGAHRLQIENHRGIQQFKDTELKLGVHGGALSIIGEQLKIRAIDSESIYIEGKIDQLKYLT